jgi:hypothetical protein
MRRLVVAALITFFAISTAAAQSCDSKAVGTNGKPLHGAAKMVKTRRLREQGGERGGQAASRCCQK